MKISRTGRAGAPVCVIVGDDAPLVGVLIWSLPVEQIDGYVLIGGHALARHRRLPGCRRHIDVNLADREAGLSALRGFVRARGGSPTLAIAADDAGCDLLAGLTLDGLMIAPAANAGTLAELRDKWSFHELCQRVGAPSPPTRLFAHKTDIDISQRLAEYDGAVVIKPLDQKGGVGVVVVRSADDFRRQVLDDPAYAFAPLIAQAFIAGVDLDISVLAKDGRILHRAAQTRDGGVLRFLDHPPLTTAVGALVLETGLSGFAHFDARWGPEGEIALLECNARPWATLAKATWGGLNFVRAAVEMARGMPTREPAVLASGVALRPDAWVLSTLGRPWRWLELGPDQRRLLFGAAFTFMAMGWRGRWSRYAGLFGSARAR